MNKQLKEYALKAGLMTYKDGKLLQQEAIEKFAEILIEKCCYLTKEPTFVIANEPKHVIKEYFKKFG